MGWMRSSSVSSLKIPRANLPQLTHGIIIHVCSIIFLSYFSFLHVAGLFYVSVGAIFDCYISIQFWVQHSNLLKTRKYDIILLFFSYEYNKSSCSAVFSSKWHDICLWIPESLAIIAEIVAWKLRVDMFCDGSWMFILQFSIFVIFSIIDLRNHIVSNVLECDKSTSTLTAAWDIAQDSDEYPISELTFFWCKHENGLCQVLLVSHSFLLLHQYYWLKIADCTSCFQKQNTFKFNFMASLSFSR